MHRVSVIRGDITRQEVDAVVNAANQMMLGGGGVDGAIHRAAGPRLLEACRRVPEMRPGVRCPTGEARITPAFDLPARIVIHTVGPVWRGGVEDEPDLLASCYREALGCAREQGARSVAFPAISTGVYGFPADRAARIAVGEIKSCLGNHDPFDRILLVAFQAEMAHTLQKTLDEIGGRTEDFGMSQP